MESSIPKSLPAASNLSTLTTGIWSRLIELMNSFDCPTTKNYVTTCITVVDRIILKAHPLVTGIDLVTAIQTEVPIPTLASELKPVGILGLIVNLITIVVHSEEDPIESIVSSLKEAGVDFMCLPGAYDRES